MKFIIEKKHKGWKEGITTKETMTFVNKKYACTWALGINNRDDVGYTVERIYPLYGETSTAQRTMEYFND
jgi:hypothetical protein